MGDRDEVAKSGDVDFSKLGYKELFGRFPTKDVPVIPFDEFSLSTPDIVGVKESGRQYLWTEVQGVKVLAIKEISQDPLGEKHTIVLTNDKDTVKLEIGFVGESDRDITIMDTILRTCKTEDTKEMLPQGIAMKLYSKLPQYLQEYADKNGSITHELSMGLHTGYKRGKALTGEEWMKRFGPFISLNGYQNKVPGTVWERVYSKGIPPLRSE